MGGKRRGRTTRYFDHKQSITSDRTRSLGNCLFVKISNSVCDVRQIKHRTLWQLLLLAAAGEVVGCTGTGEAKGHIDETATNGRKRGRTPQDLAG